MTDRFEVGVDEAGGRLDATLARWLGEPRTRAAARIDRGEVRVDGAPVARSARLVAGQVVTVAPGPAPAPEGPPPEPPPVRWEDEHLAVVAKPAGMVVHRGAGTRGGTLVEAMLSAGFTLAPAAGPDRPGIVHRLDRGTSGLLVVAKTDAAYRGLVDQLRRRDVHRGYLALVDGVPPADRGRIEAPIARHERHRTRFAVLAGGKPALTYWSVRAHGRAGPDPVTLLDCRLGTGRTHQIRVHLAYAGHPVCGDRVYGASRAVAAALGLERPFLHAGRLRFRHPVTGTRVAVDEPPPEDLRLALAAAGIDADVR